MARPERVGEGHSTVTYRGLRDWIDQVDKLGELLHVNGAHWDREMGAITQMRRRSSSMKCRAIQRAIEHCTGNFLPSNALP